MATANEIVRRKAEQKRKDLEAKQLEVQEKPSLRKFWERKLQQLEAKAIELKNCNACARRRAKIAEGIAQAKKLLGL